MKEAGSFRLTLDNGKPATHFFSNEPMSKWAQEHGFDKTLLLGCNQQRPCRLAKTRAYVCVDEDENGPIVEAWAIRRITTYNP